MTHFDFVLYHKPEKKMQVEDPLSRQADHEMGIDLDNTNQVLLKPEFFAINALKATHESPINNEIILKEVKAALLLDEDYKSLLKSITNFIQPYLHQFFDDSHGINGYGKPLKRPFN